LYCFNIYMNKYHIILVVLLGMFLMPNNAFACGKGSEKSSCKKEISSNKTQKKSCCADENTKDKDNKGCGGKCGHSGCGCSSTCPTSLVSFVPEISFQLTAFNFPLFEKINFLYTTPSISDGFYSIWLIPKIS